jgi:uncharacterized membrane protein
MLPAIFGILSCWYIYKIGKELAGEDLGIIAALLAAFSPLLIWQSQLTRMYIMCVFFSSASTFYFLRWINKDYSFKNAVLYSLNMALGLYFFYMTGIIWIAHNIYMVAAKYWKRSISLSKWFRFQVFILISYSPWLWVLWRQILDLRDRKFSKPRQLSFFMTIKRTLGTLISTEPMGNMHFSYGGHIRHHLYQK